MGIITRKELRSKAIQKSFNSYFSEKKLIKEAMEFSSLKTYDIFLSHSYLDAIEIDALYEDIKEMGFSVYIDWKEDRQLDRSRVTSETAKVLKERMNACSCLLYVVTDNTTNSKWCPWELGYLDGKKGKSAILPILDIDYSTDSFNGTEYLGIYPYVTKSQSQAGDTTLWVREDADTYVRLSEWLKGTNPYKH